MRADIRELWNYGMYTDVGQGTIIIQRTDMDEQIKHTLTELVEQSKENHVEEEMTLEIPEGDKLSDIIVHMYNENTIEWFRTGPLMVWRVDLGERERELKALRHEIGKMMANCYDTKDQPYQKYIAAYYLHKALLDVDRLVRSRIEKIEKERKEKYEERKAT